MNNAKYGEKKGKEKMKRTWKKLSAILIAAMLAIMSVTVVAQAQTLNGEERIVTLYPGSSRVYNSFWGKYVIGNITTIAVPSKGIVATNLKSSNPDVATAALKKGVKGTASQGYTSIYVKAKSVGTTTISYKIGPTTFKQKITVKPYTNPLSKIKVYGKNITSNFKKQNVYYMSYKKYANKSVRLSYQEAGEDWIINYADYLESVGDMKSDWVQNNGTFKVTKKNSALMITAANQQTGATETLMVVFR